MITQRLMKQKNTMIAYCPLDLPRVEVDEDLIHKLIDHNNPGHHDNIWETLPLVGRVKSQEDFTNAEKFEEAWVKRYDAIGEVLYNERVMEELKPIFDQLKRLPIEVTHAQLLRATRNVPKHHDMKHKAGAFINDLPADSYEPGGWKIQLTKTERESFYVCKDWESDPQYIKIPTETNTFVINEKEFPHGSDLVEGKVIVSIFGLVDRKNANTLIERSLTLYHDHAICFESHPRTIQV